MRIEYDDLNALDHRHNYVRKLLELRKVGEVVPGHTYVVYIYHDSWCLYLKSGGLCTCTPDVTLKKDFHADQA